MTNEAILPYVNCEKNRGHVNFIRPSEFTIDHLPPKYQDEGILNYIRFWSLFAVRVEIKSVSMKRPDTLQHSDRRYPMFYSKGKRKIAFGSGLIDASRCQHVTEPCPCPLCLKSEIPKTEYWTFIVHTVSTVVHDDYEAKGSSFKCFFTEDEGGNLLYGLRLLPTMYAGYKEQTLRCQVLCLTHDQGLVNRLLDCLKATRPIRSLYNTDLGIMISYPHGGSQRISIGRIKSVDMEIGNIQTNTPIKFREGAKYNAPSPIQMVENENVENGCFQIQPGIHDIPPNMTFSLPEDAEYLHRFEFLKWPWFSFPPGTKFAQDGNDIPFPPETKFSIYYIDYPLLKITHNIDTCPGSAGALILMDWTSSPFGAFRHIGDVGSRQSRFNCAIQPDRDCVKQTKIRETMTNEAILPYVNCEKNRGHVNFIRPSEFTIDHLPPKYQDEGILNYIRFWSLFAVRVEIKSVSMKRPDTLQHSDRRYPMFYSKGKRKIAFGSGLIDASRCQHVTEPCPCPLCLKSEIPKTEYWTFIVHTVSTVVHDDYEAKGSSFKCFFTEDEGGNLLYGLRLLPTMYAGYKEQTLRCQVLCLTHDQGLVNRLLDCLKATRPIRSLYNTDLGIMISYPHGGSQRISIGRIKSVDMEIGNIQTNTPIKFREGAKYNAPSPIQMVENENVENGCFQIQPGIHDIPPNMTFSLPEDAEYLHRFEFLKWPWFSFPPGTKFAQDGNDIPFPPETKFSIYYIDYPLLKITHNIDTCPGSAGALILMDWTSSPFGAFRHIGDVGSRQSRFNCAIQPDRDCVKQTKTRGTVTNKAILQYVNCTKNPGHVNFIRPSEFTIDHLPPKYQDEGILNYIRFWSLFAVRVKVKGFSMKRPDTLQHSDRPYPMVYSRGKITAFGSGMIDASRCQHVTEPCPCPLCLKSKIPKTEFWTFIVHTVCTVVYDDCEAKRSSFECFVTEDERGNLLYGLRLLPTMYAGYKEQTLRCQVLCLTHDQELVNRLLDCLKATRPIRSLYNTDLGIMISYPHGLSQRISIGRIKSVDVEIGNIQTNTPIKFREGAKYNAPSPIQMVENENVENGCFQIQPGIHDIPPNMTFSLPEDAEYLHRFEFLKWPWFTFPPGTKFAQDGNDIPFPPETKFSIYYIDYPLLKITHNIDTCPGSAGAMILMDWASSPFGAFRHTGTFGNLGTSAFQFYLT